MELKNVIVLDTETANTMNDPLTYDIGWVVVEIPTGRILKTESYAVAEIFYHKYLMSTAYYFEKLPIYWNEIRNGKRKVASLYTVRHTLKTDCQAYGVTEIYAHNASFDYKACQKTQRYTTCSAWRWFFPKDIIICDTLKMARQAFGKDPEYRAFCIENDYLTKRGQCRLTAEILYRYITGDNEFIEEHRGLQDVLIEMQILLACIERGVTDGALWE